MPQSLRQQAGATRPNILLIMSDQHHPRVMGCAGDEVVRTPHLDGLAREGVRFSSAYCGSPLCVPSRMSFMTSRHCSDIEVWTNGCELGSDIPTFAHSLGAAGYETVLGGRMHFMGFDQRHGFHRRLLGDISAGVPGSGQYNLGHIPPVSCAQQRETVQIAGPGRTGYTAYDDDVLAACIDYLQQRDGSKPFCLVAGFLLPHCPYIAPRELYEYYLEALPEPPANEVEALPSPVREIAHRRQFELLTAEEARRARAAYCALVEYLDTLIGHLLAALAQAGLSENTIVIYTSDHGDSIGERGLWCKTTFNEASVGVPLLMRGVPGIPADSTVSRNVSLLDLGPTMIDYAGATALPLVAGRSLRPLIEGQVPQWWDDTVFAEMVGYAHDPAGRMVRQGPWKLIQYEHAEPLLYNLEEDPGELTNRAGELALRPLRDQLQRRALAGFAPDLARHRLSRGNRGRDLLARWWRQQGLSDPDAWIAPEGANVWPDTAE